MPGEDNYKNKGHQTTSFSMFVQSNDGMDVTR
jgi:hypothetical protein